MAPNKYSFFWFWLSSSILNSFGNPKYTEHAQKVTIGHIWEKPREETHDATEVVIDGRHEELRLICILKPPLPKTKDRYLARDELVKWLKITKTHDIQQYNVFWSDDQSVTAISFSNFTLSKFGAYSCSYGAITKTINITVNNLDEVKRLTRAVSHDDLEGVILNIKDKIGLETWHVPKHNKQDGLGLSNFNCPILIQKARPTSVHQLRPEHLDLVLSVGGPISAGVAAITTSVLSLFSSFKSVSFSSGGKRGLEELITLPSLLKKYNPMLKGSIVKEEEFTTINYGTSISNLPGKAQALVNRLKSRKDIDFNTSWKLLTMSLDYEDFCIACKLKEGWQSRLAVVEKSLDILHSQIPRMLVNLVLPPNVTELYQLPSSTSCQPLYRKTCECLETENAEDKKKVKDMLEELKNKTETLVEINKKYDSRKDFTVVIQPFWSNINWEQHLTTDVFASDCHHLSLTGQERVAINLWNNMFQPYGKKSNIWNLTKAIKCPTSESPYIYTMLNSPMLSKISDDDSESDSTDYSVKEDGSSSAKSIGIGVGLTILLICLIIITVLIIIGKQRRRTMAGRIRGIRVLAVPWRKMKEKV